MKKYCYFKINRLFQKQCSLQMRNSVEIFHATNTLYKVWHFDIVSLRFRNSKMCNTFRIPFTRKRGCHKAYFLIWSYLNNVSYNIIYTKILSEWIFFSQNSTHIRQTYFNISNPLKLHRDSKSILLNTDFFVRCSIWKTNCITIAQYLF